MGGWRWLALLALLAGACAQAQPPLRAAGPTQTVAIDTQRSLLGFEIRTRYGQRLTGRFPVFSGQVQTLADGRHQVSLVIDARSAEVSGHRRYTGWLRGAEFFDVQHHPQILLSSQPHPADTALAGGDVEGELTLRGIRGPIRMRVMPAARRSHASSQVMRSNRPSPRSPTRLRGCRRRSGWYCRRR